MWGGRPRPPLLASNYVRAEPPLAIGLVVLVVAFEPDDLAVALEGQHVRGDAIEEPAIVADDDGAAGEVEQRLLERAQRVDVEIVGRLVEQQQVAALLQQLRQVHAVALAARQRADLALLRRALEVEPRHVGARRRPSACRARSRRRRRRSLPRPSCSASSASRL